MFNPGITSVTQKFRRDYCATAFMGHIRRSTETVINTNTYILYRPYKLTTCRPIYQCFNALLIRTGRLIKVIYKSCKIHYATLSMLGFIAYSCKYFSVAWAVLARGGGQLPPVPWPRPPPAAPSYLPCIHQEPCHG